MKKQTRLFLLGFFAAVVSLASINYFQSNIEDFLYAREMAKNPPSFFTAQISQKYTQSRQESWQPPAPENCQISAQSGLAVEIAQNGDEAIIFEKNSEMQMPIASLTKLMTAIVASEFYPSSYVIEVSERAVNQMELSGFLRVGERMQVKDLLNIMLIESSNDAAFALTEPMAVDGFVALMNLKAKDIGLTNTIFYNPTGLDGTDAAKTNFSTANDLIKLGKYLLETAGILSILSQESYPLYLANGNLHHMVESTNALLSEFDEIIGGKTGYTELAGGCLFIISRGKESDSFRINVVLNSAARFADMRKLLTCDSFTE